MADPWDEYFKQNPQPGQRGAPGSGPLTWSEALRTGAASVVPRTVMATLQGIPATAQALWAATQVPGTNMHEPIAGPAINATLAGLNAATHPQRTVQQAQNAINAGGQYVRQNYTDPGAFKRTIAEHPETPVIDASAVAGALATLPEGGEGGLLDVPAINAISRASRIASDVTNPIGLGARALGAGARAAQRTIRGGPKAAFGAPGLVNGEFTPQAKAVIQQAFPNGQITDAELADPKFRQALTTAFANKGVNSNSVREAVLQYNGAPTPRAQVTGRKPPPAAQDATTGAVGDARSAINQQGASIAGGPPHPSNVAAALQNSAARQLRAAGQRYTDIGDLNVSAGPKLDAESLTANMQAALQEARVPSTPQLLERSISAYPQANEAAELLRESLLKGNTRLGGNITGAEVAELRSQLTPLLNNAKGKDSKAVGAIIDAFHKTLEDAADAGQFVDETGQPNRDVGTMLRQANEGYKAYQNTFNNSKGPASILRNALGSMTGSARTGLDDEAAISSEAAQRAAQPSLTNPLSDSAKGPAVYNLLTNSLDPEGAAAVRDYVRRSALAPNDKGQIDFGGLRDLINSPMNAADHPYRLFTPEEQSRIRLMDAGNEVLNTKLGSPYSAGSFLSSPTAKIGAAALGAGAGLAFHHPDVSALAGALHGAADTSWLPAVGDLVAPLLGGAGAGFTGERLVDNAFGNRAAQAALKGAPAQGAFLDPTIAAADTVAGARKALPYVALAGRDDPNQAAPVQPDYSDWDSYLKTTAPPDQDQSTGGRIGYATGGTVEPTVDELVDRLMKRSEQVKKAAKAQTKPLLNVPDNTVAKALSIAQGAMA